MSKEFKKGDKVRALQDYNSIFTGRAVFVKGEIYEVASVRGNSLGVVEDSVGKGNVWGKDHFELVETAPTLKDLLVKAKELYDRGLLKGYGEADGGFKKYVQWTTQNREYFSYSEEYVEKGLKYLQSLEVETFKIETVEDFKRIKGNAKIELVNGTVLRVNSFRPFTRVGTRVTVSIENPKEWGEQFDAHLSYSYLKGATVTQQREVK